MTSPTAPTGASLVDTNGNSLRLARFRYEREPVPDYNDSNWLRCDITIDTSAIRRTVDGTMLTEDLRRLISVLNSALASGDEVEFEPLEPYISLVVSREADDFLVTARLDLDMAIGPVLEYDLRCSRVALQSFLADLERAQIAFPIRGCRA
jgi:hypothetical protein